MSNLARFQRTLRRKYFQLGFDREALDREEQDKFALCGLDEKAGRARLDEVLADMGRQAFRYEKDSVHWLVFACLSLGEQPSRILELGTFDGVFTDILARLFPDARITTLDLPADDPLIQSYGRETDEGYRDYISRRTKNLEHPNVELVERNSFFAPQYVQGPFDLAWVDAGHLFPEVAWDVCNAYHLCGPGAPLLFDDVIFDPAGSSGTGRVTSDVSRVLSYLDERIPGATHYFVKRRSVKRAADPRHRKYIAMLQKPR